MRGLNLAKRTYAYRAIEWRAHLDSKIWCLCSFKKCTSWGCILKWQSWCWRHYILVWITYIKLSIYLRSCLIIICNGILLCTVQVHLERALSNKLTKMKLVLSSPLPPFFVTCAVAKFFYIFFFFSLKDSYWCNDQAIALRLLCEAGLYSFINWKFKHHRQMCSWWMRQNWHKSVACVQIKLPHWVIWEHTSSKATLSYPVQAFQSFLPVMCIMPCTVCAQMSCQTVFAHLYCDQCK